jgi:hypothetical protein
VNGAPGSWGNAPVPGKGNLSPGTLSTTDDPGTPGTYWYGIHIVNGAGLVSTEVTAKMGIRTSGGGTTSNFLVFDGIYLNKDARKPYLTDFLIAYGDWFWPSGTVFSSRTNTPAPNESYVRARAHESVGRSYQDIVQVDIEHWMVDLRYYAQSVVDQSIGYYLDVLSWMNEEEPGLTLGYFGLPLYETQYGSYGNYKTYGKSYNPEASPELLDEWRRLNDYLQPVTDASDVLFPQLYAMTLDQDAWVKFAQLTVQEFKRIAKGKPVYPLIWPEVYDQYVDGAGDLIGYDFWKLQLQTLKDAGADGVVIWAPSGFNWNPNDGWWTATKEFVSGMDSDSSAPSKVTVTVTPAPPAQTTGNFTVSWTASTDAESGIARYELWRAPDVNGAPGSWGNAPVPGKGNLSPGTLSTTDDPGTPGTYWYGIHVVNGAGLVSTEVTAKMGIRTSGGGGVPPIRDNMKTLIIGGWPWSQARYEKLYDMLPTLNQTYGVDTLVVMLNYSFEFQDLPGKPMAHLRGNEPFKRTWAAALVERARAYGIQVVPAMNLFGHQTSRTVIFELLAEYPSFKKADNSYAVALNPNAVVQSSETGPGKYPAGTSVRTIIKDLMDDMILAFDADALHTGLDEVEETNATEFSEWAGYLRDHLVSQGKQMWMWGDRLLPGGSSCTAWYDGYFESADNGTAAAIDTLESQHVVVTDWHYAESRSAWYSCNSETTPRHPGEYPSINPSRSNSLVSKGFATIITTHDNLAGTQEATRYAFNHVGDGQPSIPKSPNIKGAATVFWGDPLVYLNCLENSATCPSDGVYTETVNAFKWQMLNYKP